MAFHASAVAVALPLLVTVAATSGCKALESDKEGRRAKSRTAVAAEYQRLGFMVPLLDAAARTTVSCADDTLPGRLKKSSRFCERLALTDEDNVRRLFGGARPTPVGNGDWEWMRTGQFDRLRPRDEIPDGLKLQTHESDLERLADTNVGIFTRNESPPAEARLRYRGWLLIVDTVEERLRCQVPIDADVAKVFTKTSERRYDTQPIQTFLRAVDEQLVPITRNFCAE